MIKEIQDMKDKKIKEMYSRAMKELNKFFGIKWTRNKPPLVIMKDRSEVDSVYGRKTEDWVIGCSDENKIYLLDWKNFEKESSHEYSDENYFGLIKHELAHQFFDFVSKTQEFNQFIWFSDGVAVFLAEQYKDEPLPRKFGKFLSQYSEWNGKSYFESGYAVKLLVDNFGKEKLIKMIKSLKNVKSEKDFNLSFKKIYGKRLNYEFFNKLLERK